MNKLQKEMRKKSFGEIGKACNVTRQAASVWFHKGKLPDTEYLTEDHPNKTHHAANLSALLGCDPKDLLYPN